MLRSLSRLCQRLNPAFKKSQPQIVLATAIKLGFHCDGPELQKAEVEVTFHLANGDKIKTKGKEGDSLLDIIVNNNLDVGCKHFGACEGTITCMECHVVLSKKDFKRTDKPALDEEEMLESIPERTHTSRLACQIKMTKELSGLEVRVPAQDYY